jgi:hypothetical protein
VYLEKCNDALSIWATAGERVREQYMGIRPRPRSCCALCQLLLLRVCPKLPGLLLLLDLLQLTLVGAH